jgi:hypothetical protein
VRQEAGVRLGRFAEASVGEDVADRIPDGADAVGWGGGEHDRLGAGERLLEGDLRGRERGEAFASGLGERVDLVVVDFVVEPTPAS